MIVPSSSAADDLETRLPPEVRMELRDLAARSGIPPHRWYAIGPLYEVAQTIGARDGEARLLARGCDKRRALERGAEAVGTNRETIRARLKRWRGAYLK